MISIFRRLTRSRLTGIVSRYTVGSVIAAVVTEATLLLLLGLQLAGPSGATAGAWILGAVVNYYLKRNWTWRRTGRSHPWREVLPYWVIALVGLGISMWTTGLSHAFAPSLTSDKTLQTLFVGAVFGVTYVVLFVAKFLLFHYVLFGDRDTSERPRRRRSRDQVPKTTRA